MCWDVLFKFRPFSRGCAIPYVGGGFPVERIFHKSYLDMILYTHNMNKSISSHVILSESSISYTALNTSTIWSRLLRDCQP